LLIEIKRHAVSAFYWLLLALLNDIVAQPFEKLIEGNSNDPTLAACSLGIVYVSCRIRVIFVVDELVSVSVALYLE